jgi:hypothetical protein
MDTKHQAKLILITEDGVTFLCIRQLYVNNLRTGQPLDGKIYQGRKFELMGETNGNHEESSGS